MFKMAFDGEKALETLLYIANRCPIKDIYHIVKIQFFADRKHLERNGRFITGDSYIAMKNGPVASNAYNFLKVARGEQVYLPHEIINSIRDALEVKEFNVKAKRHENSDYLSQSDIDCLEESIAENGELSFTELNNKSHDSLWQEADRNNEIVFEAFVKHSKNSEQLRSYLNG
ncbi:SocA family protein [Avibacterium sp. 20-15]|uniref:Panacea domain-containing protein n=1 Tax=unclassified Avibacterium TaxID=2685287 RepID=UPI002026E66A|nr:MULTISPECIES: Panacea domain-containing protein [unclassified Avibacterium]MCW9733170.1 SocA family protein [Avibacterium sp. 20-15]URL05289.1 SocA family protein [Avibacterium sp. 20-132]